MKRFLAALILVAAAAPMALAGERAEQGRALLERFRDAVVTVELTVTTQQSFSGQGSDEESKAETTGTVIAADGLTVVSLSATDPTALVDSMMPPEFREMMKMSSTVKDARLILSDGTELEAEIVLRDKDLDLAFLRPLKEPETDLAFVDLSESYTPQLLEELIRIGRLGKIANRTHSVEVAIVNAIVDRPRTFYIAGLDSSMSAQGAPAFSPEGQIAGIFVMRMLSGAHTAGMNMMSMMSGGQNFMMILLPAADVLESASQAPARDSGATSAEAAAAASE